MLSLSIIRYFMMLITLFKQGQIFQETYKKARFILNAQKIDA